MSTETQVAITRTPSVHSDGVNIRRGWGVVPTSVCPHKWHTSRHYSVGVSAGLSSEVYPIGNPVLVVVTGQRVFRCRARVSGSGDFLVDFEAEDGSARGSVSVYSGHRLADCSYARLATMRHDLTEDEETTLRAASAQWERDLMRSARYGSPT